MSPDLLPAERSRSAALASVAEAVVVAGEVGHAAHRPLLDRGRVPEVSLVRAGRGRRDEGAEPTGLGGAGEEGGDQGEDRDRDRELASHAY